MHRRHQHTNIPTEIVRTVVAISETGSFSKAAERLALSQPAISAQIKRLQILVGCPVFEKSAGGVSFTDRGKLILAHAKKLLDANDQILSIGGTESQAATIRLGLSALYADQLLHIWLKQKANEPVSFYCNQSGELLKALADGYLDVACLMHPPQGMGYLVQEWEEEFVWVRSKTFVLSPGSVIPIVGWPGSLIDESMIQALERDGLAYRSAFSSPDHHARTTAVAAGIGLMGLPLRHVTDPLVVAREYYLPKLAPVHAGIWLRPGFTRGASIVEVLKSLAP